MMDLQENLQQVEANICKACENAGIRTCIQTGSLALNRTSADKQSEIYHWKDRTHPFGGQSASGKRNRKTGGKTKRNRLDSCRGQYCRRGE